MATYLPIERTTVEFTSDAFPPYADEEKSVNPGIWGKRLAELIISKLPGYGIHVDKLYAEDWGWEIAIRNEAFPIYIGCCNQTNPNSNRFTCSIEPSKPVLRRGFFKKVNTVKDVERVAKALEKILIGESAIKELRWPFDTNRSADLAIQR